MAKNKIKKFLPDGSINPEFLEEHKRRTLIESTGSSMRLSGLNITNKEVGEIVKQNHGIKNLIFVDCEATGKCPSTGQLTEFGAVAYPSRATFHGVLAERKPSEKNSAPLGSSGKMFNEKEVFEKFEKWLVEITKGERPVFVSDNPAFDWQWINDGFWRTLGRNPFGHSARRISDFYAGLVGDFMDTQSWKKLRVTPHDHNPVNDAMGNVEAFERLLNGER